MNSLVAPALLCPSQDSAKKKISSESSFRARDPAAWWNNRLAIPGEVSSLRSSTGSRLQASEANREKTVSIIVAALKRCSKTRDLERGKELHRDAVAAGIQSNKYVSAVLIAMYSKCRCMALARQVFDLMVYKDRVSWNSLILGYAENGESSIAMDLFNSMDCKPDAFTYVAVLKACGGLASEKESERQACLQKGIEIHQQAKEQGFTSDIFLSNTLVDMYSKCGSMNRAREVFDGMVSRTLVTWTALIMGYVQNGKSSEAMDLFARMDCEAETVTYIAAIKACAGLATEKGSVKRYCLERGIAIHKQAKDRGHGSEEFLANALIDMYSKCGSMQLAREVFDSMVRKDAVAWNILILGYADNGENSVAMGLFNSMDCKPDSVTYVAVLKACGGLASEKESEKQLCLEKGIGIHKQIEKNGFDSNIVVGSALVDMYSKCGCMDQARKVFNRMRTKNVITWNSLIMGYVQNGESSVAMDLFNSMDCAPSRLSYVAALQACRELASEKESEKQFCLEKAISIHEQVKERGLDSELFVANSLVDLYSKCGSMARAREVFDRAVSKDVVIWNSLILGYVQHGESSVAMDLLTAMDCKPNVVTFVAALKACSSLAAVPVGLQIHATICELGLEQDQSVSSSLMDFYGKCGSMSRVEEVFNNMHSPDEVSWTAFIAGYSFFGDSSQVFNQAKKMGEAGVKMDPVSLICILTACSHAGLIDEAKLYIESALRDGLSLKVEHYACMIDMLGRADRLQEALSLVKSMPFEADNVTWMTLLDACRKSKNVEVGKAAFDALVAAGTQKASAYMLMSDIYA